MNATDSLPKFNNSRVTMNPNTKPYFQAGDYVRELLVTDTRCYYVVRATDKSIWIRPCKDTQDYVSEQRDGNPFPLVWTIVADDEAAPVKRLGRRQDGTYRTWATASALKFATRIEGRPARFTDYRF